MDRYSFPITKSFQAVQSRKINTSLHKLTMFKLYKLDMGFSLVVFLNCSYSFFFFILFSYFFLILFYCFICLHIFSFILFFFLYIYVMKITRPELEQPVTQVLKNSCETWIRDEVQSCRESSIFSSQKFKQTCDIFDLVIYIILENKTNKQIIWRNVSISVTIKIPVQTLHTLLC